MTLPMYDRDRDAWTTPVAIVSLVREAFGKPIDLDPCSNRFSKVGARTAWNFADDGLSREWNRGKRLNIYVNPPYSKPAPWMARCLAAARSGARVIACVRCDTSTLWFRDCWKAEAICFPFSRVKFDPPPGVEASTPTFPVALPLWARTGDPVIKRFAEAFAGLGKVVML